MSKILDSVQIIIALLLVASILLQARGSGLGEVFGGGGEVFQTKRGVEKVLFFTTIILATLFFIIGIFNVVF